VEVPRLRKQNVDRAGVRGQPVCNVSAQRKDAASVGGYTAIGAVGKREERGRRKSAREIRERGER
jgi:hypothetical protein